MSDLEHYGLKSDSALSPKSAINGNRAASFDHLVGAGEKCRRNGQSELLRGLEVDDQVELGRLLNRKIGCLRTSENLVNIDRDPPEHLIVIRRICDQPACFDVLAISINRGKAALRHELGELDP